MCLDCNGFQHGQRRECGGVKPERPNWHRVRGGKFPRNLPFRVEMWGDCELSRGWGMPKRRNRKRRCPAQVERAPVLLAPGLERDGPRGVRGLGARGPSRKTNAVLRTRFPVSRKKLATAGPR